MLLIPFIIYTICYNYVIRKTLQAMIHLFNFSLFQTVMDIVAFIAAYPGWLLGAATALLIFTLILFLVVAGVFTHIDIKTQESTLGPMVMAYKTNVGSYKVAGDLFTESWSLLPHREQIGLYYDDPEVDIIIYIINN